MNNRLDKKPPPFNQEGSEALRAEIQEIEAMGFNFGRDKLMEHVRWFTALELKRLRSQAQTKRNPCGWLLHMLDTGGGFYDTPDGERRESASDMLRALGGNQ